MKKVIFKCSFGPDSINDISETFEFKDDVSEEEIENENREWFFNELDTFGIERYWEVVK